MAISYTKSSATGTSSGPDRLQVGESAGGDSTKFFELDTATVTGIITKSDNWTNIGSIWCIPLNAKSPDPIQAFPLDPNVKQYPVIGEQVVLGEWGSGDKIFYQLLNSDNSPNFNGRPFKGPLKSNFSGNKSIIHLSPNPGDTIIQSRFGSSIRMSRAGDSFGSSYDPSILISNGLGSIRREKRVRYMEEDIVTDGSVIFLTSEAGKVDFSKTQFGSFASDKYVLPKAYELSSTWREKIYNSPKDLKPEDRILNYHEFTYPASLNGNQIYISSDRLVFSAKAAELLMFSHGQLGFFTDSKFSIDADKGVTISAPRSSFTTQSDVVALISPNIFLGVDKDMSQPGFTKDQPALLGTSTLEILVQLIGAMAQFADALKVNFQAANDANQLKLPTLPIMIDNFSRFLKEIMLDADATDKTNYDDPSAPLLSPSDYGLLHQRLTGRVLSNKVFLASNEDTYTLDEG